MKNVVTSVTAFLLVIWYSLSVIGFDVHTCSDSGESYVATVIGGTACDDIHPEHDIKDCPCCHHGHDADLAGDSTESKVSTRPCCSDNWQMIVLTGCKAQQKHEHYDECHCGLCPPIPDMYVAHTWNDIYTCGLLTFYDSGSGSLAPLDVQRSYYIWRI